MDINKIDKKGNSNLHNAIIRGSRKIVKILVHQGADVRLRTKAGLDAIRLAIYKGDANIVKDLLNYYEKKEKSLLLHIAASLNEIKIVHMLIAQGLNINTRDISGRTALHWAAQEDSFEVAKVLLNNGIVIDALDDEQFTPLAIAISEGHIRFAKLLVARGAKVNKKVVGGSSLHLACAWGHERLAGFLISRGAKVNVRDDTGQTPLHLAAENCQSNVIMVLCKNNANSNIKDNLGNTAIDLAGTCNNKIRQIIVNCSKLKG